MRAQIEVDLDRLDGILRSAEDTRIGNGGTAAGGAFTIHRVRLLLPMEWQSIKDSALKRALDRLRDQGVLLKGRKGRYSAWWLT